MTRVDAWRCLGVAIVMFNVLLVVLVMVVGVVGVCVGRIIYVVARF